VQKQLRLGLSRGKIVRATKPSFDSLSGYDPLK
jgi:hypothetical protein